MSAFFNPTVMWLTWRQLFARRRLWFALAFSLTPALFTLVFLVVADDGNSSRVGFYQGMLREVVLGTILPLAAVVFGTTAFGGEVDDGTLVYLLVKPLARWHLVVSKYVVAALSTLAVSLPAIVLPWLLLRNPELSSKALVGFLAGAGAACLVYNALFLSLGLATKRALVAGLLYVIGFEGVLARGMAGVRAFSVKEYGVAIAQAASDGSLVFPDAITMSTVRWMGTIVLVGATVWTMRKLLSYEVAERL